MLLDPEEESILKAVIASPGRGGLKIRGAWETDTGEGNGVAESSLPGYGPFMQPPSGDSTPLLDRITIDPEICHGKPVIRGLRYTVESMLEYLAGGDSFEELLAEFPDLEKEDLLACIQFAALSLKLRSRSLVAA